jgi:hypothetical protein
MTLEELQKIPLQYTFGYSAEDHGLRQYINEEHRIAKQVYTPRKISTGEWGKGETTFKLTDTNEEFETIQGLLDAINAREKK